MPFCLDSSTAAGLPQSSGSERNCIVRLGWATNNKTEGADLWMSRRSSAEETLGGRTCGEKVFGEVQLDMTLSGPAVLNGFKRSLCAGTA